MKKFIIALAVVSLSVGIAFGSRCHRRRDCCPQPATECCVAPAVEAPCATTCSTADVCAPAAPTIPTCTTTRKVPYTAYRDEVVYVAPIRQEIPQPARLECQPQPDLVVRHKQAPIIRPDLICRTKMPCKWVCVPQPSIVRYSCPIGSTPGCAAACA